MNNFYSKKATIRLRGRKSKPRRTPKPRKQPPDPAFGYFLSSFEQFVFMKFRIIP